MCIDLVTEGGLIEIVADGFDAGIRRADLVPRDIVAIPMGQPFQMAVVG